MVGSGQALREEHGAGIVEPLAVGMMEIDLPPLAAVDADFDHSRIGAGEDEGGESGAGEGVVEIVARLVGAQGAMPRVVRPDAPDGSKSFVTVFSTPRSAARA